MTISESTGPEILKLSSIIAVCTIILSSWKMLWQDRYALRYGFWRAYVTDVIYRYFECGDLHFGFARVRCQDCGHEYLLTFSCKRRKFCSSCHQKRVVEYGKWLCTQVLKLAPTTRECLASPSNCGSISV